MADDGPSNGAMLTSWKEIAAFFSRDVRTVQRWEREEGLPVHRHQHSPNARKHSIYAYRSELEAWWTQHQTVAENGAPAAPPPRSRRTSARRFTAIAAAVVAAAGLGVWSAWALAGGRTADHFPVFSVADLAHAADVAARGLHDVNGDGRADLLLTDPEGASLYFGADLPRGSRAPDVRLTAQLNGTLAGSSLGDIDGDGLNDLAISILLNEPDGYRATGPTAIVRGRREWPSALALPRDADIVLSLDVRNDARLAPCALTPAIDLNGDGLHDVVLGGHDFSPPGRRSAGGVFVVYGRSAWPSQLELGASADVTIAGTRDGDGFGARCGAGDFNGDGRTDLAVLANESVLWNMQGGRGKVRVFAGRPVWPRVVDAARDPILVVEGTTAPTGWSDPYLRDIDGDGVDDLVVGKLDEVHGRSHGRVLVYFGGAHRAPRATDASADVVLRPSRIPNGVGEPFLVRDLNGDGRADLVIGDPVNGTVQLILGRERWQPHGDFDDYGVIDLLGQPRAGAYRLVAGDFDGDGLDEIAFTASTGSARSASGLVKPYLPLTIDVRPNPNAPNVILQPGPVVIGVARRGTTFDRLDPASLRVLGQTPLHTTWSDFTRDAVPDLQLYFDSNALPLDEKTTRLAVIGRTRDGVPVAGTDYVSVIPVSGRSSR